MFLIPAAIIAIIYLVLKILVPVILIIAIITLIYIYYKNRGQADEKIEETKEKLTEAKTKVTNIWEKAKLFFGAFFNKNKEANEENGEEMEDV